MNLSSSAQAGPVMAGPARSGRAPSDPGGTSLPAGAIAASCEPLFYPDAGTVEVAAWPGEGADAGGHDERLQAAGAREGEQRALAWYTGQIEREREGLRRALEEFARQREQYFLDLEREAVQLTLRMARKILEREARVEPLAVAAMVHVALAPLQAGTVVKLRVHPEAAQDWRLHFSARAGRSRAASGSVSSMTVLPMTAPPMIADSMIANSTIAPIIVEDGSLAQGDCVLETEMGTATISLQDKLKEVEAGFLELLAQRPQASA